MEVDTGDNKIYRLSGVFDDPRYEGFFSPHGHFLESVKFPLTSRKWSVKRMKARWNPPAVSGRVKRFNDFPVVDLIYPTFSQRAVQSLGDLLKPNGELLPLKTTIGEYFVFNTITVADVLDRKSSVVKWNRNGFTAFTIDRYEFLTENVARLAIFRIPEEPLKIFVTELFANRARDCGLNGLDLILVWPLPPGVRWQSRAGNSTQETFREGIPLGKSIKGNAIYIRVQPGSSSKSNVRDVLEKWINELDELLLDSESAAASIGHVERFFSDDLGENCLILSCPDADALADKLMPWLRTLRWPGGFTASKRYGNFADTKAPEAEIIRG